MVAENREEWFADLEAWQRRVAPPIERLIRDQEYGDHRQASRDKAWRAWAVRVAVAAGCLTITGAVATWILAALRYLHVL